MMNSRYWPCALFVFTLQLNISNVYAQETDIKGILVYSSNQSGYFEIYKLNGREITQLTNTRSNMPDYAPVLSHDKTKLTFVSYRKGGWRSWVMNIDGTNAEYINKYNNYNGGSRISPDGEYVVFNSARPNSSVYVCKIDGSDQKLIVGKNKTKVDYQTFYGNPSWSPDGKKILFSSNVAGSLDIYSYDLKSERSERITDFNGHEVAAVYSPDESKILFTYWVDYLAQIVVINADGSDKQILSQFMNSKISYDSCKATVNDMLNSDFGVTADWSPDGKQIIYPDKVGKHVELFVMDADGNNKKQLTFHLAFTTFPSWK